MDLTKKPKSESKTNTDGGTQSNRKRKNPFIVQQRKEDKDRRQKKKARIFVRNISFEAEEGALQEHFSVWGDIEELHLLKHPDGRLVGCAFVQYANISQASKAISRGNEMMFLGRPLYIDWALGHKDYVSKKIEKNTEDPNVSTIDLKKKYGAAKGERNQEEDFEFPNAENDSNSLTSEEDKKISKHIYKEKHKSNDIQNGCTIFIKNVPFDAGDADLRKVFRKFGPVQYAIINREPISHHSKGTAFVKYKSKESADVCLQSSGEIVLMNQSLEPYLALSKDEINIQENKSSGKNLKTDSRNLYLAREGLIMANSKSAEGVSTSDMAKRHKLEQIKTQLLKNLNRFISRNRLSIHNLPLYYDNDKLKQLVIKNTGFRPHECRVMRENKITLEHPKGKAKGFGFMSFNTHKEALAALRKLNNNPKIFGVRHRPIVAFSIEDRAVQKIKEKREQKSKIKNPTYQEKIENKKEIKKFRIPERSPKMFNINESDNKNTLKKHIQKLEKSVMENAADKTKYQAADLCDAFVGMIAKPGLNLRMRSKKKIIEQAEEHRNNIKEGKRKEKAKKVRQMHFAERKAIDRPKQGKNTERDDLQHLVNKYKNIIGSQANTISERENPQMEVRMQSRSKWYTN